MARCIPGPPNLTLATSQSSSSPPSSSSHPPLQSRPHQVPKCPILNHLQALQACFSALPACLHQYSISDHSLLRNAWMNDCSEMRTSTHALKKQAASSTPACECQNTMHT